MAKTSKERLVIFISFVVCCVSTSLLAVSFGTEGWISTDCVNNYTNSSATNGGTSSFGLFTGEATLILIATIPKTYKIVCLEHQCMYSSAETQEDRENSLNCILHPTDSSCKDSAKIAGKSSTKLLNMAMKSSSKLPNIARKSSSKLPEMMGIVGTNSSKLAGKHLDKVDISAKNYSDTKTRKFINDDAEKIKINDYLTKIIIRDFQPPNPEVDSDTVPELMSKELWVATIALLSGALLFAVVGSIFAVINTATTPIEFITGVPGLYIWNGLAAALGLSCVICWGVQYSLHLTSNVLIEDAAAGWTTKGMEHLGYSYWLVVGAVLIHLANCALIAIGTYERKVKTQYEAPETKPGNIMLY